jgi:hypothetical protein
MNDSDIKALLNFLIILAGDIEKIVAKGSLSLLDLPGLYGAFSAASPALGGLKGLPAELASLNDDSIADIRSYVQANIAQAVPSPAVDDLINEGLALGQQIYDFIESLHQVKAGSTPVALVATPAPTPAS